MSLYLEDQPYPLPAEGETSSDHMGGTAICKRLLYKEHMGGEYDKDGPLRGNGAFFMGGTHAVVS